MGVFPYVFDSIYASGDGEISGLEGAGSGNSVYATTGSGTSPLAEGSGTVGILFAPIDSTTGAISALNAQAYLLNGVEIYRNNQLIHTLTPDKFVPASFADLPTLMNKDTIAVDLGGALCVYNPQLDPILYSHNVVYEWRSEPAGLRGKFIFRGRIQR